MVFAKLAYLIFNGDCVIHFTEASHHPLYHHAEAVQLSSASQMANRGYGRPGQIVLQVTEYQMGIIDT